MVVISLTKDELYTVAIALEGYGVDLKEDKILIIKLVGILTKMRKSLRKIKDKYNISIILDTIKEYLPVKKKPLKKGKK